MVPVFSETALGKNGLCGAASTLIIYKGFRCQADGLQNPETESAYGGKPHFSDNMLSDKT